MSSTLIIYEQTIARDENNRQRKILTEIACIWGSELIEEMQDFGQRHWHLSSECGSEFELQGDEILDFADKIKKYDKEFNDNQIDINDWYRCVVCY